MIKKELEVTEENLKRTIANDSLKRNSKLIMLSKLLAHLDENIIMYMM